MLATVCGSATVMESMSVINALFMLVSMLRTFAIRRIVYVCGQVSGGLYADRAYDGFEHGVQLTSCRGEIVGKRRGICAGRANLFLRNRTRIRARELCNAFGPVAILRSRPRER